MSDDQKPQKSDRESLESASLELVDKLLRGEIMDHQAADLSKRLEESPELRAEYLRQAVIHSKLLWSHGKATSSPKSIDPIAIAELIHEAERAARLQAMQEADELRVERSSICDLEPQPMAPNRRLAWFVGGALAASVLIALTFSSPQHVPLVAEKPDTPPVQVPEPASLPILPPVVAQLLREQGAVWSKVMSNDDDAQGHMETVLSPGARFRQKERFRLQAGFASITTSAGSTVSLESPCELEFVGANHVELIEGKLIGECANEESQGLVVDTPTRRIVDLGTEFGVWVDSEGGLFAEVFEGKIATSEITAEGETTNVRELAQAEAMTVDKSGTESTVDRNLDESPFNQLAAARMGIVKHTDDIVFLSHPPEVISIGSLSSQKGLFVIEELRSGFNLPVDLNVSLQGAGEYESEFQPIPDGATVDAGTVVRSYIVHMDCTSEGYQVRQGRITFDGDILGVISNPKHWNEFNAIAPGKACRVNLEAGTTTLLEDHSDREDERKRDVLHLVKDGRSMEFSLTVSDIGFDTFRVIVSMPEQE